MPTPTKSEIDAYMNAAQAAMFQYQLIEEGLKTYISMAHEVIRRSIPADLAFAYDDREFESMPLERLLNSFAKLTLNKPLLAQLNKLREPRNYVAHKAFALAFFSSVNKSVNFHNELERVVKAQDQGVQALFALKDELDSMHKLKNRICGVNGGA